MTTKKTAIGAALCVVAFTLAGCEPKSDEKARAETAAKHQAASAPAPTAATAAKFDPCSVLTADEVTAVTGVKVTKTEVIDHDCHYDDDFNDDGTVLSIYLSRGGEEMEAIHASNKLLGGIGSAVAGQGNVGKDVQSAITPPTAGGAPAMGDEAVWEPNAVLAVRKGDAFVQVRPPIAHDPASHHGVMIADADKRVISQKLAKAVLTKLAL